MTAAPRCLPAASDTADLLPAGAVALPSAFGPGALSAQPEAVRAYALGIIDRLDALHAKGYSGISIEFAAALVRGNELWACHVPSVGGAADAGLSLGNTCASSGEGMTA